MRNTSEHVDVVILDGNHRSALAATRSLGKRGIRVAVGSEISPSLASYSRYCTGCFSYTSPYASKEGFLSSLRDHAGRYGGAILLPMTDVTLSEVLENREYLKDCFRMPFPPYERYIAASDKVSLFLIARDLSLPMPKTLFSSDYNDSQALLRAAKAFGFPVVVKPARSRFRVKDSWLNTRVRYAGNEHVLRTLLDEEPFKSFPYIVQERIIGPGVGIFLLIHNGEVLATFAHRRIREKPPSGGVSVVCESVEAPPEALNSAVRLLEKLNWSGVAMVEYKWDVADNLPKLMEINARFWGSLQLAVSAGVDFPYLFFRLANGEKTNPVTTYKIGMKSRWELGDLDHLLIRMRKESAQLALPPGAAPKWRVLTSFLGDFFKPSVRHEVLRPDDPEPFLCELKQYFEELRN